MSLPAIRRATGGDLLLLLATVTMWAGAFVGIKVAVPALGPLGVAAARAALGAIVVAPFAMRGLSSAFRDRRTILVLVGLAQLNIALPFTAISWAETTIDAGVAALLMGTGPFFAMLGAHLFLDDEPMSARRGVGVAVGFAGILVLVGGSALSGFAPENMLAYAAMIGATLCYVSAGVMVRKVDLPPVTLAFSTLFIAATTLVPLALLAGPGPAPITSETVYAVAFLGVFPTGIAYVLRYHIIQRIGYSTFALGINMIPVFGVILGVVILGEALSTRIVLSLALVLAGLAIARTAAPNR